ncbi:Hypothetical protein NGAL_HAMBI2605_56140 [Neorhizobium galegae bv. orientalis]|nr:Hypothetical protein NGAL_HAMBI2566_55410 [Neorhizobium galegae bv. orientalis]CDZ67334.1 Hypothetical protein NGAL_HAMBI2605_56140 [Neorhizobium galegae bv. orientalis]CDZ74038.1 Hypothetical protein NGAL_HAMBI2610_56700 [Neorhizobium galegae bv. orientalis]
MTEDRKQQDRKPTSSLGINTQLVRAGVMSD